MQWHKSGFQKTICTEFWFILMEKIFVSKILDKYSYRCHVTVTTNNSQSQFNQSAVLVLQDMESFHKVFIVALLICTANGHHPLRGCQDIDPTCALLDEFRALGGMLECLWSYLCISWWKYLKQLLILWFNWHLDSTRGKLLRQVQV